MNELVLYKKKRRALAGFVRQVGRLCRHRLSLRVSLVVYAYAGFVLALWLLRIGGVSW